MFTASSLVVMTTLRASSIPADRSTPMSAAVPATTRFASLARIGSAAGLLSSQGQDHFYVYDRQGNHAFRGKFTIDGVKETDGVDVLHAPFGDRFPAGIFGCHNGTKKPCPVIIMSWDAIAEQLTSDAATDAGR